MRVNRQQPAGLRRGLLVVIAAVAVLACSAASARAGESVAIELIDGISVSGKIFRLGDIARYGSGSEEFWQAIAAEPLGYAPAPGASVSLAVNTLLGRLAERGYDWRAIEIAGPDVMTIHGAQQDVATAVITDVLAARVAEELGVSAVFNTSRALPPVSLPDGDTEITVRFPDKPGWWLPDAVEFRVNGMLSQTLLLSQYGEFSLPVLVAPAGIPGHTLISGAYLSTEERELRPGSEVITQPAQVLGMTTRGSIAAGAQVLASRLRAAYDVTRGSEVTLVIRGGAVELRAQAVALNDAYLGQALVVRRVNDDVKFKGRVEAGPVVVVE